MSEENIMNMADYFLKIINDENCRTFCKELTCLGMIGLCVLNITRTVSGIRVNEETTKKEAAPKKKTFDTAEKAFVIASLKKLAEDINTKS